MFTAQRRGQTARHASIHDLRVLELALDRHDFEERTVHGLVQESRLVATHTRRESVALVDRPGQKDTFQQRARLRLEIGSPRFANQSSRRSTVGIRIGVIQTVDVLYDREPSECVGEKKCTRCYATRRPN
jgi:hypothetical protein